MSKFAVRETNCDAVNSANNHLSGLFNEWLATSGPVALFKSCANCAHMDPSASPAKCNKFNANPPASVIVAGCSEHADAEEVPF